MESTPEAESAGPSPARGRTGRSRGLGRSKRTVVTPEPAPVPEKVADEGAWETWLTESEPTEDRLERLDAELSRSPHRLSRWADAATTGRRSHTA